MTFPIFFTIYFQPGQIVSVRARVRAYNENYTVSTQQNDSELVYDELLETDEEEEDRYNQAQIERCVPFLFATRSQTLTKSIGKAVGRKDARKKNVFVQDA